MAVSEGGDITVMKNVLIDKSKTTLVVIDLQKSIVGRQDIAFGLFNLPTYRESAYLLCGTTPPFVF